MVYSNDLINMIDSNNDFLFIIGDIQRAHDIYCFSKNRILNNNKLILLKMPEYYRHWNNNNFNTVKNNNIKYENKYNKIIWRGATTGEEHKPGNRFTLIKKYFNKNHDIDVGFYHICQNKHNYKKFLKKYMSINDQLKYKFILSVEGNDVASGLKWQLYSKSIVMMAKPNVFTWLMEDKLIPGIHYILLKDDFSNLEEQFEWAKSHPNECQQIIKNANKYMEQFMDKENEDKLQKEIIKRYFDKVKFN